MGCFLFKSDFLILFRFFFKLQQKKRSSS